MVYRHFANKASFPAHPIPNTESLYYDQYLVQLVLLVNPGFYSRICYFHTSKPLSRPNAWTQIRQSHEVSYL